MRRPIIALLSDFGVKDPYVAEMKGVILNICPEAEVVDITHEIEKFNVRELLEEFEKRCLLFRIKPSQNSNNRVIIKENTYIWKHSLWKKLCSLDYKVFPQVIIERGGKKSKFSFYARKDDKKYLFDIIPVEKTLTRRRVKTYLRMPYDVVVVTDNYKIKKFTKIKQLKFINYTQINTLEEILGI